MPKIPDFSLFEAEIIKPKDIDKQIVALKKLIDKLEMLADELWSFGRELKTSTGPTPMQTNSLEELGNSIIGNAHYLMTNSSGGVIGYASKALDRMKELKAEYDRISSIRVPDMKKLADLVSDYTSFSYDGKEWALEVLSQKASFGTKYRVARSVSLSQKASFGANGEKFTGADAGNRNFTNAIVKYIVNNSREMFSLAHPDRRWNEASSDEKLKYGQLAVKPINAALKKLGVEIDPKGSVFFDLLYIIYEPPSKSIG